MDALLAEVDGRIGLERLRAVHVNDAATALGSNSDRHANLGAGVIGRGLAAFVGHPRLRGLPQLLETPGQDGHGPDADQIRRLRELRRSRRPAAPDDRGARPYTSPRHAPQTLWKNGSHPVAFRRNPC